MKRIYIFIASVISLIAMSVPASAYEPTVREDRVWHYEALYTLRDSTTALDGENYRFKGFVERNGKIYAPLVRDDTDTVALMRQESGKVYYFDSGENAESLLYDFDAREGDKFSIPACARNKSRVPERFEVTVKKTDSVIVDGKPARRLILTADGTINALTVIEGLGPLKGWIYLPMNDIYSSGLDRFDCELLRVADNQGKTVWRHTEISSVNIRPMLVEGRTWEYWNSGSFDYQNYVIRMSVNGDTTINNTGYKIINEYYHSNHNRCFMREEGGRVWKIGSAGIEELIYDFNMVKGESYSFNDAGITKKCAILSVSQTDVNGIGPCFIQNLLISSPDLEEEGEDITDNVTVMEMLGATSEGTLNNYGILLRATNGYRGTNLMKVYDADGTILYWNRTVGIESVETDASTSRNNPQKYDLMGREIKEPAPGTVYIQGGRKLIAR